MVKAVGAWPRLLGHGQSLGGVAKVVRVRTRPLGRGQGRGGVAKALVA